MFKLLKRVGFLSLLSCITFTGNLIAQGGNTVSGHVFGDQNLPLEGITVELLDEFSRSRDRVRTNSSGRYFFNRMPAGNYLIKVSPFGTNFLEDDARVEIQNIVRVDSNGQRVVGAFMNVQRDFYLRLDREKARFAASTVFVQEIPESAKKLYDEALVFLEKKKKPEAYQKLKNAIETFPDYYMATEVLGLEYISAGHYRASAILMERALQINPKSYKCWYGLAYSYYSLNLEKEGLNAVKSALTINPSSAEALLLAGTLERRKKNYRESEQLLIKAKKFAKPPNPDIHWQLALLYGKNLDRFREAAEELEALLKLQPNTKDAEQIKKLIKDFRKRSMRS